MRSLAFISFYLIILPIISKEYNILKYGAIGDGRTLNTSCIQKAIDSAHMQGGGQVIIPTGKFLTGSIILKSNVDLHLENGGVLLGSINTNHYEKRGYWKALILAKEATNISISGRGTIDGQGQKLALRLDSLFHIGELEDKHYNFVEKRPRFSARPLLIQITQCENIVIKDVHMTNAACWVQNYDRSKNILIESIYVDSDAFWNNDGIDISDCSDVIVRNSYVNASDDGICLKSHFKDYLCENISIENCEVRSSASAIKLGTKSIGGFKDIHIKNIKVFDTFRSAVAIESVDGGLLENIFIDSIEAFNTGNAIFIRLGQREKDRPLSQLKNVHIKNIVVDVAYKRPDYKYKIQGPNLPFFHNIFPSSITGIPNAKIKNVTLENISINFPGKADKGKAYLGLYRMNQIPEVIDKYPEYSMFGELPAWGFYLRHVEGIRLKNIQLNLKDQDYRHAIVMDDVKNLSIERLITNGDNKSYQVILKDCIENNIQDNIRVKKL